MNLRHYTFVFLLSLSFTAFLDCSRWGEIRIRKDEFKDVQIVQLKLWNFSCLETDPFSIDFLLSREFADSKSQPATVIRFIISAPEKSFDLEPDGFIKIDERKFNVKFEGVSGNVKTETYSGTRRDAATGKEVSYSGVNVSKQLKGVFQFTKEQENLILESNELLVRVYSGSNPITFSIKKERLEKLKEFLKTNPPEETRPTGNIVPDKKDQKRAH